MTNTVGAWQILGSGALMDTVFWTEVIACFRLMECTPMRHPVSAHPRLPGDWQLPPSGWWKAAVSQGKHTSSPSPKQMHNSPHCHGEFNPLVLGLALTGIPRALTELPLVRSKCSAWDFNLNTQPATAAGADSSQRPVEKS